MVRNAVSPRATRACLSAAVLLTAALSAHAAVVTGSVRTSDDEPASDARVTIVELARSTFVDDDGAFRFEDVPDGDYHVSAASRRHGSTVAEVAVAGDTRVDLSFRVSAHVESIVVSAGTRRGEHEVYTPIQVLDDAALREKLRPTLGETLAAEPGVRATSFAPGASRPIIRGQGGGRIRILEGGLDVGDASSTSPDHAVTVDPATAERVEILRGPATLLYGSTAVGGAVNVIDRRIPEYVPNRPVLGSFGLRYGSAADDRSGTAEFNGGAGPIAWHVDAATRETGDVDIPGRAVQDDPSSSEGTLPNSAMESSTWTVGGSWVGDRGFVGLSLRSFDTTYGIPAELEEEEPAPLAGAPMAAIGDDGIAIDLEQRRIDLRGALQREFGPFQGLRVAAGLTDYEHAELEGGAVGTRFLNESTDVRVELPHGSSGRASGVIGIQAGRRDFEAIGDEAFVPPSLTDSIAAFAVEEIERGRLSYEFGLRYERQNVDADGRPSRSFDGLSGSVGTVWRLHEDWTLGGSITRAVRLPSAEELYADGPHIATLSYEVGDPDLREESSLGFDVDLRRRAGRVTGELSLFFSDYDDFIYEQPTGAVEDGLPVFLYRQSAAEFYGFEFLGVVQIVHTDRHDFDVEIRADRVRGSLAGDGGPLPRMPADTVGAGVRYRGDRWYASAGVTFTDDQTRVAAEETPTDGYTWIDATVGYRVVTGKVVHDFMVRGTNLGDREARPHTSRLKRFVPLPGRDVTLSYRLVF